MALSSQWSQSVVVRADRAGGEVVVQPTPSSSSARAYAAVGNPIIVRPRDPNEFTASGAADRDGGSSGGQNNGFVRAIVGRDVSETFWIPDPTKNEMGLLETLYRRGSTNRTHVLLQSRPLAELQFNYSTCTGLNIDLSHNAFRLSKTAMALHNMDRNLADDADDLYGDQAAEAMVEEVEASRRPHSGRLSARRGSNSPGAAGSGSPRSTISMSTRDFKRSMRASLQTLQEEDYYLVRYRDYSAWATTEYRSIAKSDSYFGRKYVEQCFAVHVGREPGELIPITEPQFLFGVDILQRQLLNQLHGIPLSSVKDDNRASYAQYQTDINYSALNADQFRSLGALLGDGLRQVGVEGEEKKLRAAEDERRRVEAEAARSPDDFYHTRDGRYLAPAWYDWSPGAMRARVHHQLSYYYGSVGRLTVQLVVLGAVGYMVYYNCRDYLPSIRGGSSETGDRNGTGRGNGRRSGGRGGGGYYDDGQSGESRYPGYRAGFLRSVLMGPKEVFDYFLAPSDMR